MNAANMRGKRTPLKVYRYNAIWGDHFPGSSVVNFTEFWQMSGKSKKMEQKNLCHGEWSP